MALYKKIKELQDELDYWKAYQPVNGMGKWARSVRVASIEAKINKIEKELEKRKKNKK